MFVWPSAVLMGCLLTCLAPELRGRSVLEIGAGVGLPSVLASKYGASKVVACERPDALGAVENLARNLRENCAEQVERGECAAVRACCCCSETRNCVL
jgi:predicted nicotinamide N-methyase